MHIEEIIQKITPLDAIAQKMAQARFDALIKPVGSLAQLETMTARYAGISGKYDKNEINYPNKALLSFANLKDAEKIFALIEGKDPLNILADFANAKAFGLVLTADNEWDALDEGVSLVQEYIQEYDLGLIGMASFSDKNDKFLILAMAGGILAAASMKVGIMIDGDTALAATRKAKEICPDVMNYIFGSEVTTEEGNEAGLKDLAIASPLRLSIPQGIGSGACLAFTVFDAGLKSYKEMETFQEAGVHVEMKEFSMAEAAKKGKNNG
ncbi:MAG: nicotinate-nucleotide--dimethylbenzimidazole phosphoribosyltransferase [Phascolarctobacterium sp.]|nr:nicotinate-nucleotide--dimethylbenzimidazole phosphoribosyltransferase [Phascolarctobacterium sp.]